MEIDEKYNLLINKLKNSQPQFTDNELVTNLIINKIDNNVNRSLSIIWLRAGLSVAAMLLLSLFFVQPETTNLQNQQSDRKIVFTQRQINKSFEDCISGKENAKTFNVLIDSYLCYSQNTSYRKTTTTENILKRFKEGTN